MTKDDLKVKITTDTCVTVHFNKSDYVQYKSRDNGSVYISKLFIPFSDIGKLIDALEELRRVVNEQP